MKDSRENLTMASENIEHELQTVYHLTPTDLRSIITLAKKPESKNFLSQTSAIHQKKRIASRISTVCDIKSVPGAPEEIFHF